MILILSISGVGLFTIMSAIIYFGWLIKQRQTSTTVTTVASGGAAGKLTKKVFIWAVVIALMVAIGFGAYKLFPDVITALGQTWGWVLETWHKTNIDGVEVGLGILALTGLWMLLVPEKREKKK